MTSNIGSQYLLDGVTADAEITPEARELGMGELRHHFRPEFLNRIDDIVLFTPLSHTQIERIVELMFDDLRARLTEHGGVAAGGHRRGAPVHRRAGLRPPGTRSRWLNSGNKASASPTSTPPQRRLSASDRPLNTERSSVTYASPPRPLVRGASLGVSVHEDLTAHQRELPAQGQEGRRLACSVRTKQGDDLARSDFDVDGVDDRLRAIPGGDPRAFEYRCHLARLGSDRAQRLGGRLFVLRVSEVGGDDRRIRPSISSGLPWAILRPKSRPRHTSRRTPSWPTRATSSGEGRTVDIAHLVVSEGMTRDLLYVGMTRGRERNWAHVVTGPADPADLSREEREAYTDAAIIQAAWLKEPGDLDGALAVELEPPEPVGMRERDTWESVIAAAMERAEMLGTAIEAMRAAAESRSTSGTCTRSPRRAGGRTWSRRSTT